MKTLIFICAFAFSLNGFAQTKKSVFGAKDEKTQTAETKAADTKPAEPAKAAEAPKAPAKKAEAKKAATPAEAPKAAAAAPPKPVVAEEDPTVKEEETGGGVGDTIECKSGTDVRKLIIKDKGSGCEVEYTKFGDTKVIGGAQYERDICTNVVGKVRGTLEGAGFTCN